MFPAPQANLYDRRHARLCAAGSPAAAAALAVVDAYLEGKPVSRGKRRLAWAERDEAFWSSAVARTLAADDWRLEGPALALTRYFRKSPVAAPDLLETVATTAPDVIVHAVRRSGLVRNPASPRRQDLARLGEISAEVAELCRVMAILDRAEAERRQAVAHWTQALAGLSPFELLAYASLYAFEHLATPGDEHLRRLDFWEAIDAILAACLATTPPAGLEPTADEIARCVGNHLSPFLFPGPDAAPRVELREAFARLVEAQIEFNAYVAHTADAFCYDDGVHFVRQGGSLDLVVVDDVLRETRQAENDKLARLHCYWFYRAVDALVDAGAAVPPEAERLAWIRARQAWLRLTEVYGVSDRVSTGSGAQVDLFRALLALNLMSAFFQREFIASFAVKLQRTGHWQAALAALATKGLQEGMQLRLPLTWSARAEKIERLAAWTASAEFPEGDAREAAAILDFWTSDWTAIAARLRRGDRGIQPALFERPVLRLGEILVQLPWVVGLQDNSAAAINNLRRLGSRRGEAGDETRRIEASLGEHFAHRGFRVLQGWQPAAAGDAGEVDLLCAGDGVVLLLEIKSTYLRQSIRDTWVHATSTLRHAGRQLQRKLEALRQALARDAALCQRLGLDDAADTELRGWIVDTSIECDHRRFGGFLKVSLEEVLIALRDERGYLHDPAGSFSGRSALAATGSLRQELKGPTLYPDGFSATAFVAVIESGAVWHPRYSRPPVAG